MSERLATLQQWLHDRKHYWPGRWLGNGVSSVRYYAWRVFTAEGRDE